MALALEAKHPRLAVRLLLALLRTLTSAAFMWC